MRSRIPPGLPPLSPDRPDVAGRVRVAESRAAAAERDLAAVRRRERRLVEELTRLRSASSVRLALRMAGTLARTRRVFRGSGPGQVEDASSGGAVQRKGDVQGVTPGRLTELAPEPSGPAPPAAHFRQDLFERLEPSNEPRLRVRGTGRSSRTARLLDATSELGWAPSSTDADVLLITGPHDDVPGAGDPAVTVAIVEEDVDIWLDAPWFDDIDLVLSSSAEVRSTIADRSTRVPRSLPGEDSPAAERTAALRRRLSEWVMADRAVVVVGIPGSDDRSRWGDEHFARGLQRALERRGRSTRVLTLAHRDSGAISRADVAVHLFGRHETDALPGQTSVLWIISHPERVTDEQCEAHDMVLAASERFADELRQRISRPVHVMHQATDPDRFHPAAGPAHDLLFIANSRGEQRTIPRILAGGEPPLAVYGEGWRRELLPRRHLLGRHVPNGELGGYYASAKIVLNDHWADMSRYGFLSNRLYDALASGAFVISDHVEGIDEEFDGSVVTFSTPVELMRGVDRYLPDASERAQRARRGREAVLSRHTFDHRVAAMDDLLVREALHRRRWITPPSG